MAIVVPVVFADAVNEAMKTSLKMGMLADDVTDQVAEITECGDTVNFPKYDRVAEIGEITQGTAVVPKEVSMTENKATIKQTGGAIRVYDRTEVQVRGKTMDNMAQLYNIYFEKAKTDVQAFKAFIDFSSAFFADEKDSELEMLLKGIKLKDLDMGEDE